MDTPMDGGPASPSKGGADSSHTTSKTWRSGWWDFYPILEKPRRPIVWSQSSVIFTAHPTHPRVTGRHFSSSKQFVLPSPNPVISLPSSYDPPTVISVAPRDDWLFAYYPRHDAEGLGCLWKRGAQLDSWQVKEFWNFSKSGGAVAVSWLSPPRKWVVTPSGTPTRLPACGPNAPITNPTFVVVTEDNNVIVFFYRYMSPVFRSIRRSLLNSGLTTETQNAHTVDSVDTPTPIKHCVDAAISIGYNDTSIFIASHSFTKPAPSLPAAPPPAAPFNSMDLSVPMNLPDATNQEKKYFDFETWGEDYTISVHELQFRFDGVSLSIFLHQFGTLDIGKMSLMKINFLCAPPSPFPVPTTDQTAPPKKSSDKGQTYLALTAADFHGYSLPPTSQITLFSISQKTPPGRGQALWTVSRETSRSFESGVIVHAESFVDLTSPSNALLQAFVLDHAGPLPPGKVQRKEVPVGTLHVFNLPNLSENPKYESTKVNYPVDAVGRELPLFTALSPNHGLIATLSTSLWKSQVTVHNLPRTELGEPPALHPMTSPIVTAILGGTSSEDVIHCIASPNIPLEEAKLAMYQALNILETFRSDLPYASTWNIMGVATEVYRSRAMRTKDPSMREALEEKWRAAHNICSIAACNIAFEDCKESEGYDLEAVWQLVNLCSWVVNFTETLMKTAVLSSNTNIGQLEHLPETSPLYSPPLLNLAHPFALQNTIVALRNVRALRTYLGSLPAGGENAQMAQLLITDIVDSCGIDFGGLISLLEETLPTIKMLDSSECQKALASCTPMPNMQPHLFHITKRIADSETLLNKTKLFIRPTDLIDGVARLGIFDSENSDEKDVINKGLLVKQEPRNECLRCGGKTTTFKPTGKIAPTAALRWVMWERMWQARCVCGGPWLKSLLPS